MAKFIRLTQLDKRSITLNVEQIKAYEPDPEDLSNSIIQLKTTRATPQVIYVIESNKEIDRLVNSADSVQ